MLDAGTARQLGEWEKRVELALSILDTHYRAYCEAKPFAEKTQQLTPSDTKAWSQILICALTGQTGRSRKKGSDLADGSDVKAASCWDAIDTPRFNGCLPAGRVTVVSKKDEGATALDDMPYLYFVLWDERPSDRSPRCRIWCVRTREDQVFRQMADKWYERRRAGKIVSTNFQLHPPRFRDDDVFRNECGNLAYPLLFSAVRLGGQFRVDAFHPEVMLLGECQSV